jgi:hypothetical protein
VSDIEIVNVGASTLKGGSPLWQCYAPVANDNDDILPLGELPAYQGLGVTSIPEGKDETGSAEAVVVRNISGRRGAIVGGRDTRDADIVGKLDPGDTVVHATGRGKKPQLQLKKKKRMGALVVPCKDGKDMIVSLDGENMTAQILARGAAITIGEDGSITLAAKGGASIVLNEEISLLGPQRWPGLPKGMFVYAAPITGPLSTSPGSPVGGGAPVQLIGGT